MEHQTLAGLGYCFSASLPPMLAAGALKAFEVLETDPNLVQEISRKSELLHDNLDQLKVHVFSILDSKNFDKEYVFGYSITWLLRNYVLIKLIYAGFASN